MPTFEVDVEGKTYEVDAPDTNTAWAWAYTTHRQQFGMKPAALPEKTGMLRAAADIPVQVGRGIATGVKALSDVFGADNPVSKAASGVEDYLGGLLSAQAKNDQAEIARIMKEAEDKGVGANLVAAAKAIATAPADTLAQVFGTAVPVIAGGLVGSVARLGAMGVGAIGTGVGAAMGAGTIKGQIYDAVKQELLANKVPEAEAEKRAQEAQAYGGKNLDQILMGAGIGAAEAAFGAERILTGLLRKGAVKPSALPAATRIPTAAATEAVPEMAQAAQEQVAQNIALQREGYDVPTMRGVVGQAALEGIAGMGLGAITGAVQRTVPEAKVTKEAKTPEGKVAGRTTVVTDEETAARLRNEQAAGHQPLEAESPKPVTVEAGVVQPEEARVSRAVAQEAKPEVPPSVAPETAAPELTPPMPSAERATLEAVKPDALWNQFNDDPDQGRFLPFKKLTKGRQREWDAAVAAGTADMDTYLQIAGAQLGAEQSREKAKLDKILEASAATSRKRLVEAGVIEPSVTTFSPEPSIAEDRQRAEPVVEAAAPEPVVTEAAAKPEEVLSAPEVVPQEEIARPEVMPPKKEIDRQALEEKRQTILDMIETKKERREPIPEGWIDKLTEISAQLRGEKVDREEIYSMEVAGHPMFDGPPVLRNLIPIKVKNAEAAQRALDRALELEKQVATEFYGARYALQSAKNAAAKKAAQARIKKLTDQGWDDDALKTLREETIEELSRLVDAAQKSEPKSEGEGRAAVSDEGVKKPVSIKKEQTDKERQAQINRDRQQAKRAAAEAERAEKERRKAEKEAEAKRKAEAAAARKQAKRLEEIAKKAGAAKAALKKQAEEMEARLAELKAREEAQKAEKARFDAEQAARQAEAKRKAEEAESKRKVKKESEAKAKEAEAKRKAEEAEAKRKAKEAEEAEAQRKLEALPPYEQRVKLSADDLYPQLKDFDSAVNAIYDRASNRAEKEIASLIKSRVAQFKELGFAFSLRVTPEGKMLSSGVRGNSRITFSHIGEATEVAISLNHPSNGEQSGTRWSTVAHELLHAVTQAQIRFAPEGSAAKKLRALFNDVVDYFNARAKAKTLTDFEARIYNREINALETPDELLTWGLTDKNMQAWLNGIESKKGNFLSRLYDVVASVLGFSKPNSVLAELLSVSETLLTEPTDAYVKSANLRGASFGFQENVSDVPNWALGFAEGLPVVWFEKDAALIKAESITGKTIYLVATPEGVSRGDVAGYTGNLLPPARLAEVKGIAETLRSKPEEEIRFMRSAPSPTTAGQSALDTINQLGMGVKQTEGNLYEQAKKKFKAMGESPAGTKAEIKEAVRKFFANIETKTMSSDARWDSDIKNGLRQDMKPVKDIIGASLLASQSQAVGADAVSTRAMLIGGATYDEKAMKWVAYENKDANEIVKAKVLDEIAAKYGLTKEEASQVAHTYLVSANYEGIIKRNAKLEEQIKKARLEAKEQEAYLPKVITRYQNEIEQLRKSGNDKKANEVEREFNSLNKQVREDIAKLRNEADDLEAALVFVSEKQAAMVEPGKSIADTIPEVKKIAEIWNEQRRMVKDAMVFSGLWRPEYADAMMDNAAYVPFYRETQIDADEGPRIFMRGLQVKAKEHKLKGSETAVNNVFENMAMWQQYAMNRAIRNHKAIQSIDVGKTIQVGDRKMAEQVKEPKRGMNVVKIWREGKQEFYEVLDPYYVEAFQSLGAVYIEPIKYFTAISNILRKTVVMYPLFSIGQLTQDSVAAIFASGLKPQYAFKIPYLAVKEFGKTMMGWSTTHEELKNYGAVGVRDFNAAVAREDAAITAGVKAPRGAWGKVNYMLERVAMSADNAVRQAMYIAATEAKLSKAEALEKAFEIINFRRRGSSKMLQLMGQTVPFFYAYLSAQRVAYKTLTLSGISPTERMAALETLAQTTAAVMALSFIYAMANGDDEEYKKTPSTIRDRSLMIPGSGGVRIPLRPDFFLFPKVIAEHTYQLLTDEGYSDGAKFRKSMADLLANATLSPNAVPQIIKPTFEAAINYSFFEGKPIIGYFEQNKEAGRQFNESTSEFAKWLGRFGASPQMVDHLVRGYFGSVGGLGLWGTNFFIEGEPGVPRPEITAHDMFVTMPGVGAFKQKPTENALKVDFYELRDAIAKVKNTYDDMKVRSPEGLEAFIQDEKNLARLAMDKQITKIGDHLSKIRRAIQQVAAAPESRMSASEKQERIKELRDVEMELLKAVDVKALRAQAKL